MSVSPFKTTLTNILLPNPVFSTDSIGGLAALSQISPGSFDSTQSTLADALSFGSSALGIFSAGAPFGSDLFAPAALPTLVPIQSPPPPVEVAPVSPAPRDEDNRNDDDDNDRGRSDNGHPQGGPPGQLKKQDGDGNRPGNPGNGNGRFNRKGGF